MDIKDFSSGNFFITGELGAGKTMFAIQLIREYMREGRPVVTNIDIFLENMMLPESKKTITRLPDKPRIDHFDAIGTAYDVTKGYDESKFGLIVLDECLTWLNSRNWSDKERADVVNWFLHARKKGWNIAFLLQSLDYADKQVVDTLLTYHVHCKKLAKYRLPFIGKILNLRLPKGTLAVITAGRANNGMPFGKELYRGEDLYSSYNTAQVFTDGKIIDKNGNWIDTRSISTMLSAWHLKGRYLEAQKEYELEEHKKAILKFIGYNFFRPGVIWMFRILPNKYKESAWQIDLKPISYNYLLSQ